LHNEGGAKHDKKRRCSHDLACLRFREDPKHWVEHIFPCRNHPRDHSDADGDGGQPLRQGDVARTGGNKSDQRKQRHDR
jgi:hypothetical protein